MKGFSGIFVVFFKESNYTVMYIKDIGGKRCFDSDI